MNRYAILPLCLLLGACASGNKITTTIINGECKLPSVHTPPIAVMGKTQYDQNWIDDVTEGLVTGCQQPRPQPRPPEINKQAAPKTVAAPPAKKSFWQRFKRKPKQPAVTPPQSNVHSHAIADLS